METPSEPPLAPAGPHWRLKAMDWIALALLALTAAWAAAAYATTVRPSALRDNPFFPPTNPPLTVGPTIGLLWQFPVWLPQMI